MAETHLPGNVRKWVHRYAKGSRGVVLSSFTAQNSKPFCPFSNGPSLEVFPILCLSGWLIQILSTARFKCFPFLVNPKATQATSSSTSSLSLLYILPFFIEGRAFTTVRPPPCGKHCVNPFICHSTPSLQQLRKVTGLAPFAGAQGPASAPTPQNL